jgi:S1-C subfamily serine protease
MKSIKAWLALILMSAAIAAPVAANAESVNDILGRNKRAVVKLTVFGKDPHGQSKPPAAGSGFVIQSGQRNSLILTAAHVIGSSDWRQLLNPDWLIEPDGRTLNRQVKVETLNEQGALVNLGLDASVLWQDDQKDIALLLIDRIELPSIPYVSKVSDVRGDWQHVLALGFRKNEQRLAPFEGSGGFQVSRQRGLVFHLNTRIPEGLSGGPVIDLDGGRVIAVISEDIAAGNEHDAVSLFPVIPAVQPYLQFGDKVLPTQDLAADTPQRAGNSQTVTGNGNISVQGSEGSNITIGGNKDGRQ